MLRKLLLALLVLVALLAAVAVAAVKGLTTRIETPYRGTGSAVVSVDVEPGYSTPVIARRLTEAGVVPDAWTFRLAVWQSGSAQSLQAGEYEFAAAISPLQVVDKIARGDVVLRTVTFPEGLTIKEMADVFDQSAFESGDEFLAQAGRAELVRDLDAEALNLEGYLFPETYLLPRDARAADLVEAMVAQFRTNFDETLRQEATRQGRSVRDVVTLASLIQKETGNETEHALVSAVYNNRLRIGMGLQCDPTVIYALELDGVYDGNLTRDNLQYDSPYNTYRYPGLPPGPIAAPGRAVLKAALHPADAKYLYFVSRNDGSHEFANTLREHNRNVRRWQVEFFRARRRSQE